jgi:hypothetical protein
VDLVFRSGFTGSEARRVVCFRHRAGDKLLTLCSNMLTHLNLTDLETGCKVFRREVPRKIIVEKKLLREF